MRRILLRLVVVAVMAAMLLVIAVPAFAETVYDPAGEGAFVTPKFCTEVFPPLRPIERCHHNVLTPSNNIEVWTTVDLYDQDEAPDFRTNVQSNPSDSH
jgi:hypothetical protein